MCDYSEEGVCQGRRRQQGGVPGEAGGCGDRGGGVRGRLLARVEREREWGGREHAHRDGLNGLPTQLLLQPAMEPGGGGAEGSRLGFRRAG